MKTVTYIAFFAQMAVVCGISYGFTNSVYSGTYVDATTTNTEKVGGGTWYSTSGSGGTLWALRGFANNASIFEADGMVSGTGDAPLIKTTMSGLYPYMYYDAYVVFWCSGSNWCILSGLKSDTLVLYGKEAGVPTGAAAGTATGAVEGDRNEYEALLGVGAADASGNLSVYIDDSTLNNVNNRVWYDGLEYKVFNVPFNPSPADGAVSVPSTVITLSFTSIRDPNDLNQEDPNLVSHRIYFDDDPNLADADDLLATLPKETNQTSSPALAPDKKYYWRVDEVRDDGVVVTGFVWTYETVKTMPDFDPPIGSQPKNTAAFVNENAVLTASAGAGTYDYQWYKGTSGVVTNPLSNEPDHISGATTNQLMIKVQAADEGYYWCRATNPQGSADSAAAIVVVKRNVAHWTLNAVVGGQYTDSSGEGHHADVTGSPVPVPGKIDSAIPFNGTSTGCASSGTWNPSQYSGQITVSLWANWGGQTDPATWQGLVSKEVSLAADQMMWQLEVDQGNNDLVLKNGSNVAVTATPMAIGQWEHIVFTYDGTAGIIYRNGVSVASGGFSFTSKTDAPMNIGASANNAGVYDFIFNGALDDIRVYNYAMSPYEIAELYTDAEPTAVICIENPEMDFSGPDGIPDCKVNLYDFAEIARQWLICNLVPGTACQE